MEESLFRGAKFGDKFLARNGKKLVFVAKSQDSSHIITLVEEGNSFGLIKVNDEGFQFYKEFPMDYDVIEKCKKEPVENYYVTLKKQSTNGQTMDWIRDVNLTNYQDRQKQSKKLWVTYSETTNNCQIAATDSENLGKLSDEELYKLGYWQVHEIVSVKMYTRKKSIWNEKVKSE